MDKNNDLEEKINKAIGKALNYAIVLTSDEVHQMIVHQYRKVINDFYDDYTPSGYNRQRVLKKLIRRRPVRITVTSNGIPMQGYECGVSISEDELSQVTKENKNWYDVDKDIKDFMIGNTAHLFKIEDEGGSVTTNEVIMIRTFQGIHGFTPTEVEKISKSNPNFHRPYMPDPQKPSPQAKMQEFWRKYFPKYSDDEMKHTRWLQKLLDDNLEAGLIKYLK